MFLAELSFCKFQNYSKTTPSNYWRLFQSLSYYNIKLNMLPPISADPNDIIKNLLECHNVFMISFWYMPVGIYQNEMSVFRVFLVRIFAYSVWIRREIFGYLSVSISPYSVWMRGSMDQENSKYGHFSRWDVLVGNTSSPSD